jgi:hypothetical protein
VPIAFGTQGVIGLKDRNGGILLMSFIESAIKFIGENQLLLTGLGVSASGLVAFWLKSAPKSIYTFSQYQFTTRLTVTSQHKSYYDILKWIAAKYPNRNFRTLKLNNGQWGWEKDAVTSIGYGTHWILYNGAPLIIRVIKEEANQTERDKETITITKLGRSKKLIDSFVNSVGTFDDAANKTKVYAMYNSWCYIKDQPMRPLESVFSEK